MILPRLTLLVASTVLLLSGQAACATSDTSFLDFPMVLLFSGDQDMNVDVVETVDLAQRLREQGVDVRTVILPGEGHDFVRHSAWKRLWTELDAFLTEKLK